KRDHWRDFLANLDDTTLFTASKYATKTPSPHFIPPLTHPDHTIAKTLADKVQLFTTSFFNTSLNTDLSDLANPHPTPAPVPMKETLIITKLDSEIECMAPHKAPGHDDILTHALQRIWPVI
ncbi:hypothetical protein FRB95_006260, partial [Tulasnella sp. JGI-2019a]